MCGTKNKGTTSVDMKEPADAVTGVDSKSSGLKHT